MLANIKLMLKIANNPANPLDYLYLVDLASLANKSAVQLIRRRTTKLAIARMLALQLILFIG